ncbi:MAG: ATP-binding protein [Candidatus Aerophobetes bacterium]|nr:ATP-binding protein [Candidatus Aerophobetes bacterium]
MLYPRLLEKEVLKYFSEREAIIILGARQVGKTSLLQLIRARIEKEYPCFYFDLERPEDLEKVEMPVEEFLHYLEIIGAKVDKRSVVFIDEIHYLSEPAKFIKILVDHYSQRIKLIISGSSSLEIKRKFKESLVGRKLIFRLHPLSFHEFLIFKEKGKLAKLLPGDPFESNIAEDETRFFAEEYREEFKEFLIFGGYPRIVLVSDLEKKRKFLEEIVTSYVFKDIYSLFHIEDIAKFNKMIKLLAINVGNLLSLSSLSTVSAVSRYLISQYISMLENTYIIDLISPYFTNKKKEVIKSPRIYFSDNGLRNYIVGDLNMSFERQDIGALLENMVFSGLKKGIKSIEDIHFWRTQNKAEVDFILERGGKFYPIEVNMVGKTTRALYAFMDFYKIKEGYVVYPGSYYKKGNIHFLPVWWIV